jgi:hypothetical protein
MTTLALEKLPSDVLQLVMQHLDAQSLLRMARCSVALFKEAASNSILWENLHLAVDLPEENPVRQRASAWSLTCLAKLEIRWFANWHRTDRLRKPALHALSRCLHISALVLPANMTASELEELVWIPSVRRTLSKITIRSDCQNDTAQLPLIQHIAQHAPHIRVLHLSRRNAESQKATRTAICLPNLVELKSENGIAPWMPSSTALKRVVLKRLSASFPTFRLLTQLFAAAPLEEVSLDLEGDWYNYDLDWIGCFSHMDSIQHLTLRGDDLEDPLQALTHVDRPNLRVFCVQFDRVHGFNETYAHSIQVLLATNPGLAHVRIFWYSRAGEELPLPPHISKLQDEFAFRIQLHRA